MEKIIIFSHESDIDGMGSVVLSKIAFPNLTYILAPNVQDLEEKFRKSIDSKEIYNYDKIYVTDLALYNPAIGIVANDSILSKKVLIFDHHKTAINEGYDKYDFSKIIEEENGNKRTGTDLYYEHLYSSNQITRTPILDDFVDLTRLEDTWEWKKAGERGVKAHDMAILFNIVGQENYIERMVFKIKSNDSTIEFTEEEKNLISKKKQEYQEYLKKMLEQGESFVDNNGNKLIALFANYEYRNELAEYVRALPNNDSKYIIIVALDKGEYGQKSYRTLVDNFNVGDIAEEHGGNGHPEAASVNITSKQNKKCLELRDTTSTKEALEYIINCKYEVKGE